MIDFDFNVKRCALRFFFWHSFGPQTPPDPPKPARRAARTSWFGLMFQPLADWLHRSRAQVASLRLYRDNLYDGQALRDRRHAVQVFATTSALRPGERTLLCRARAYGPVACLGPGRAGRAPEQ